MLLMENMPLIKSISCFLFFFPFGLKYIVNLLPYFTLGIKPYISSKPHTLIPSSSHLGFFYGWRYYIIFYYFLKFGEKEWSTVIMSGGPTWKKKKKKLWILLQSLNRIPYILVYICIINKLHSNFKVMLMGITYWIGKHFLRVLEAKEHTNLCKENMEMGIFLSPSFIE